MNWPYQTGYDHGEECALDVTDMMEIKQVSGMYLVASLWWHEQYYIDLPGMDDIVCALDADKSFLNWLEYYRGFIQAVHDFYAEV